MILTDSHRERGELYVAEVTNTRVMYEEVCRLHKESRNPLRFYEDLRGSLRKYENYRHQLTQSHRLYLLWEYYQEELKLPVMPFTEYLRDSADWVDFRGNCNIFLKGLTWETPSVPSETQGTPKETFEPLGNPCNEETTYEQPITNDHSNKSTENNIMSKYNTQAVANPTFVFGRDTSEMTQEDYLTAIRKINKDIESYVDIKGSEAIKEVVNNLKKDLKVVTALLDTSVTKGE